MITIHYMCIGQIVKCWCLNTNVEIEDPAKQDNVTSGRRVMWVWEAGLRFWLLSELRMVGKNVVPSIFTTEHLAPVFTFFIWISVGVFCCCFLEDEVVYYGTEVQTIFRVQMYLVLHPVVLVYSEDGSSKSLRNIGIHLTSYNTSHHRRQ